LPTEHQHWVGIVRISELEQLTGFTRSAIYHYRRVGLLPPMHRLGGSPAVYGPRHVQALLEIRRMKEKGLGIGEIRSRLEASGQNGAVDGRNLVAEQSEATRRQIIEAAARHFAARGYRGARLIDIVSDAGVATNTSKWSKLWWCARSNTQSPRFRWSPI
jgi:DNA-binding transcriptional MerR regulator